MASRGRERQGMAVEVRFGSLSKGAVRLGTARQSGCGSSRYVKSGLGSARRGKVRQLRFGE